MLWQCCCFYGSLVFVCGRSVICLCLRICFVRCELYVVAFVVLRVVFVCQGYGVGAFYLAKAMPSCCVNFVVYSVCG